VTAVYTNLWVGSRLFAKYDSVKGTLFVHGDSIGSATTLTGPGGSAVQGETFYPWGVQSATGGTLGEEHYAAFHQRDPGTGLDYTLNRMYTSTQGRWLTPDPGGLKVVSLEDPQTWNLYSYVRDTPLSATDPLGLDGDSREKGPAPYVEEDNTYADSYWILHGRRGRKDYLDVSDGLLAAEALYAAALEAQSKRKPPEAKKKPERPPNSRTDVVLYPAGSGKPEGNIEALYWLMSWKVGSCSEAGCHQTNDVISGVENDASKPGLRSIGDSSPGEATDRYSREARTITQWWSAGGKRIQVLIPVGDDKYVSTWVVQVTVHGGFKDPPTFSPGPQGEPSH